MSEKHKPCNRSVVGQAVLELIDKNMQNLVQINNSRTAWSTEMLIPFLSRLNLVQEET